MTILDTELEQRAAYAQAFGRAAIAFIFTMLDFRIGVERSLDIIPDVVGYWMFIGVASALLPLHAAAAKVRQYATWLTGLAGIILLLELLTIGGGWLVLPLGLIQLVGDAIMVWALCGIVIDVANHLARPKLAAAAENRRRFYIAYLVFVATIPLFVVSFSGSDLSGPIVTLLFIALVAAIMLVIQMYGLMRVTERVVTVD